MTAKLARTMSLGVIGCGPQRRVAARYGTCGHDTAHHTEKECQNRTMAIIMGHYWDMEPKQRRHKYSTAAMDLRDGDDAH